MVHDEVADLEERRPARLAGAPSDRAARSIGCLSRSAESLASERPPTTRRGRCPGRPRGPAGWRAPGAGSPSPTNSPPDRQISRSTSEVSARTTCSIQITAMPSALMPRTISTSTRDLGVGEAARHLVEQQELGPGGERAGDLQPLALQQAEPAGRQVGLAGHPGALQRLARPPRSSALRRSPPPCWAATSTFSKTVMSDERPRHLVRPPDAEPAPGGGVQPGDRAPGERDLAGVGGQVAGDEAEQAGLASAVRPHDPDRVPGADRERQVFRDDDAAEPLRHVV